MKKIAIFILILLAFLSIIQIANALPEIKVTPDNSNIVMITGTGFNKSSTIQLQLFNGTELIYSFPQTNIDVNGTFNQMFIIPTSLYGQFNVTVSGLNITLIHNVPNLKGQNGIDGVNGTDGEQGINGLPGQAGQNGTPADNMVAYVSLVISIVAVLLAIFKDKIIGNE